MNERTINVQINDGIPETTCEQLRVQMNNQVRLIDVRSTDEFTGELGHIDGAVLVTLGPELVNFLNQEDTNQEIVFVCRSGVRSGAATAESLIRGFTKTSNLIGGMIQWNRLGFPTVKN